MIRKRSSILLLLLTSMVMLVMPVIPHHHHNRESICLKNDLTETQQCPMHHADEEACCNSVCLARFDSSTPTLQISSLNPHFVLVATLYTQYISDLLLQPLESSCIDRDSIYMERLHGANILRAVGLRAPPHALA